MDYEKNLTDVMSRIGKNVKKHRKTKGLTQQDVAVITDDMDRQTISNIERVYYKSVTIGTLSKISTALNIEIVELFL